MQDEIFWKSEGDQWFQRNKVALTNAAKVDWVTKAVELTHLCGKVNSILDIGCADGWRIGKLKKLLEDQSGSKISCVGLDVSLEALKEGAQRFPDIQFVRGKISDLQVSRQFDLVIVNSVFHWVDRSSLAKSVSEVDQVTADGGYLIIGDFYPNHPERRSYHHLPESSECFTYKQNYPAIFEAIGTYKEILKITYDCESLQYEASASNSTNRAACVVLRKNLLSYYQTSKHT